MGISDIIHKVYLDRNDFFINEIDRLKNIIAERDVKIAELSLIIAEKQNEQAELRDIKESLFLYAGRLIQNQNVTEQQEDKLKEMSSHDFTREMDKLKINSMSFEIERLREKVKEKDAEIIRLNAIIVNKELEKEQNIKNGQKFVEEITHTHGGGSTINDKQREDKLKALVNFNFPPNGDSIDNAIRTLATEIMKLRDK